LACRAANVKVKTNSVFRASRHHNERRIIPICYIGGVGPAAAVSRDIPNLGPRVSIVDHEGKLIGRFGDTPAATELGKFLAPHGLAVDRQGDIYVGEVSWTAWPQIYPGKPHPTNLRSLQKFEKVE
jgi:hypothetical protein